MAFSRWTGPGVLGGLPVRGKLGSLQGNWEDRGQLPGEPFLPGRWDWGWSNIPRRLWHAAQIAGFGHCFLALLCGSLRPVPRAAGGPLGRQAERGCPGKTHRVPLRCRPPVRLPCTLVLQGRLLRDAAPGRGGGEALLRGRWRDGGLQGAGGCPRLHLFLPEGAQACEGTREPLTGCHGWLAWKLCGAWGVGCQAGGRRWG